MKRVLASAGASVAAAALIGLAAGPAIAAATVAQASANALDLTVLGTPQSSGTYTAKTDGHHETTSGKNTPTVSLLTGQDIVAAGTLGQDASAGVRHSHGVSAACAGLAGDGATFVGVGDSDCLKPAQNLILDLTKIDLTKLLANVKIVDNKQLNDALGQVTSQLSSGLAPGLSQLDSALAQAKDQLGDAGLFLDLGAVEGVCQATSDGATGSANLANVSLYGVAPGQTDPIYLARLPVDPPPNTKVPVQLDKLLTAIVDGLETNFDTALQGKASQANQALDQVQQQLIDNVVRDQVEAQLAPVGDNLVNLTLNEQSHPTAGSVAVTALDLNLLPAANAQAGMTVFNLKVGNVTCGPNGQVAPPAQSAPKPQAHPQVPRSVPAGEATMPASATTGGDRSGALAAGALGALLLASAAAGTVAYRRHLGG